VQVSAGMGLDRAGREILLPRGLTLQVPAVAGGSGGAPATYYVTVSWLDDASLTPEQRAGDCEAEGAVRLIENCAVRFQRPAGAVGTDWEYGTDLVLGTIAVRDCKLASDVTATDRREIAPASPYIGAGTTKPGDTSWQLWRTPNNVPIGVQTLVSTAEAGFTSTPRYEARIGGQFAFGTGALETHLAGYVQILNATPQSFVCGVLLPQGTAGTVALNRSSQVLVPGFMNVLASTLQWHVAWSGVEG